MAAGGVAMRFVPVRTGLLALCLLPNPGEAQQSGGAGDVRAVVSAFRGLVVETGGGTIARMDLGRGGRDTNRFSAVVTNRGGASRTLGLSLRAAPGLWVRGNWQRGYRFDIPAHARRTIEAVYVFRRMT